MPIARLPSRAVIEVSGEDRVTFLQGLVSHDVTLAAPGRAVFAALLTPQGKWIADFFILSDGERLLLETEAAGAAALVQRLSRFRLRAKVALRVAQEFVVHAGWGGAEAPTGTVSAPDPRAPEAGLRILATEPLVADAGPKVWDAHRLALGLPEAADMEPEQTVLLEAGFDAMDGISWTKGCYMGQELTARTRYRGLLKRRLVPVAVEGELPPHGTPIRDDAGAEQGTMRSGRGGRGIALLRIAALDGRALVAAGAMIRPALPEPALTQDP
ncbi:MAG: Aminomethyltransferase family protein [Rhodospirillales bacterium]|nr:Aminomethyltransferase family protein [Rhodospirillales bacterium]